MVVQQNVRFLNLQNFTFLKYTLPWCFLAVEGFYIYTFSGKGVRIIEIRRDKVTNFVDYKVQYGVSFHCSYCSFTRLIMPNTAF